MQIVLEQEEAVCYDIGGDEGAGEDRETEGTGKKKVEEPEKETEETVRGSDEEMEGSEESSGSGSEESEEEGNGGDVEME